MLLPIGYKDSPISVYAKSILVIEDGSEVAGILVTDIGSLDLHSEVQCGVGLRRPTLLLMVPTIAED